MYNYFKYSKLEVKGDPSETEGIVSIEDKNADLPY